MQEVFLRRALNLQEFELTSESRNLNFVLIEKIAAQDVNLYLQFLRFSKKTLDLQPFEEQFCAC